MTIEIGAVTEVMDSTAAPAIVDLLLDGSELAAQAGRAIEGGEALDAFLLCAGLDQVLLDRLDSEAWSLTRVASAIDGGGAIRPRAAALIRRVERVLVRARGWSGQGKRMARAARRLRPLVDSLADSVMTDEQPDWPLLRARWEAVAAALPRAASLRADVLRLPSCFRDLDQRPADFARLAAAVDARIAARPLLVVGVRTSGSYLAPLLAAGLRRRGRPAGVLTLRPGRRLARPDARRLASAARPGVACVVVDDPPASGRALARAATTLERAGVPADQLLIAFCLLDDAVPAPIAGRAVVALPYSQWEIHAALDEESVHGSLARLLTGREIRVRGAAVPVDAVLHVSRTDFEPVAAAGGRRPRRHAEAVYHAVVSSGGAEVHFRVHARGCGLGYLGRGSLAVASLLGDLVPEHYGIDRGVLFREWVEAGTPGPPRAAAADSVLAAGILRYLDARARLLPTAGDKSQRLSGRNPVWQRAADVLAARYRGLRPLVRFPMHVAARRILRTTRPVITDGDMAPERWVWTAGDGELDGLVKLRADEVSFSNEDLASYDGDFDLAAAAVGFEIAGASRAFAERLRAAANGNERWTLYRLERLASAWRELQAEHADASGPHRGLVAARLDAVDSLTERTVGEYLGRCLAVAPRGGGPVCAIDVDGVLEADGGGHSAATPAGLLALRALTKHGFTPVLATGRSLGDVEWRCAAYGLAAAVAEYGCVLWLHEQGRVVDLVGGEWCGAVQEVGERLRAAGAAVDAGFRWTVRASVRERTGERRAPAAELIADALRGYEHAFRVVGGYSQADLVPVTADKQLALAALLDHLGAPPYEGAPIALAIGDSRSDLPMLKMARHGVAPANGHEQLGAALGVRVLTRPYQLGLCDAAALVIGHAPGACAECRPPEVGVEARLLLGALGARDAGRARRLWNAFRLLAVAAR